MRIPAQSERFGSGSLSPTVFLSSKEGDRRIVMQDACPVLAIRDHAGSLAFGRPTRNKEPDAPEYSQERTSIHAIMDLINAGAQYN